MNFALINRRWIIALVIGSMAVAAPLLTVAQMPLKSYSGALKPLNPAEQQIQKNLAAHVNRLSVSIGERNISHYSGLAAAADYIEAVLRSQGHAVHSYKYSVGDKTVRNIEVQITGSKLPAENLIVGAHYDSARGSPGADDNATGVAGVLELARLLKNSKPKRSIRFVLFPNEEPPYFQSDTMGSIVYARQLHQQKVKVYGMVSLESIGFYSDTKGSQRYPMPLPGYSDTANFIGFVGDTSSSSLLRNAIRIFRETTEFPSEGVAAPQDINGIGWSDHSSFWQEGYQAIMVTDTVPYRNPNYHRPTDKTTTLDFSRTARVVGGLQRVILGLANSD